MSVLTVLFRCSLAFLFVCSHRQGLLAQDRVLIQQPGGSRIPISGYVEDYTGREITIALKLKPNETARRYPREEVVEVTTDYTPHHERGRKFLFEGKVAEAKQEFVAALNEENRLWVRREILSGQVKCALWSGDYLEAIMSFVQIVESDPETFHYSLIPLNWTDEAPAEKLRFEAREWLGQLPKPVMKLIGASWLLSVGDGTVESEQVLKRLARESNVRLQRMAQMQLWRLRLKKNAPVDVDEIERWQQLVEQLPIELRGGSYFVIGQAWKQRQEFDQAARAFLWLPLVYDTDRWLSARACFEAADSLNTLGDTPQAANLYSEVVFRFGDTRWGRDAELAWKLLRQSKTDLKPSAK